MRPSIGSTCSMRGMSNPTEPAMPTLAPGWKRCTRNTTRPSAPNKTKGAPPRRERASGAPFVHQMKKALEGSRAFVYSLRLRVAPRTNYFFFFAAFFLAGAFLAAFLVAYFID